MILRITVALVHNKFCNKELPGAISLYGNTKLVYIVLVPILTVLAVVFSYILAICCQRYTGNSGFH